MIDLPLKDICINSSIETQSINYMYLKHEHYKYKKQKHYKTPSIKLDLKAAILDIDSK
jgi:hypothetical protein